MANLSLEDRFRQAMIDGQDELKSIDYGSNVRFMQMLHAHGAAQAVRNLIDSPNPATTGFTKLWEKGRLDLSAEAIVADRPEWAGLFTDAQREVARRRLEQYGYKLLNSQVQANKVGTDWTDAECAVIVADYFEMLAADMIGEPYSKAHHNRQMQSATGRSDGSIEFKHANISAVLVEMQQPYIDGYKPRGNYQARLADAVNDYLDRHPDFFTRPEVLAVIEPTATPLIVPPSIADIFDVPPEIVLPSPDSAPWLSRRGRRVNFTERDARNRQLGRLGEQFTLDVERRGLKDAGRDDLAQRVEWIADTCGDGVGYDVLSFDATTEVEKWIEVKTTGLGKYHPFLVTANEVRCSEAKPEHFHLFRVFDFKKSPRVFVLSGALSARCDLRPSLYTAAPRASSEAKETL